MTDGVPDRPRAKPTVDVTVLSAGHDVADARVHRLVSAMARLGLAVEVLGLGDSNAAPSDAVAVRTWARRRPAGRLALALRQATTARGDVLLAPDPDTTLTALLVARATGRRVVADVHEDYRALLRDRSWARGVTGVLAGALAAAAERAAAACDLTVVADEHVPPLRARCRLVVRNLPDPSMLPEPAASGPGPRAVYIGDVRASRGLFAMIDAVSAAPGWELDVVGPVAPADAPALTARLDSDGVRGRVRVHGRMPPARAWEVARGAWCGLALLEDTPAFRSAVPSKLYEYLACGLPVVVTDLPAQASLVRRTGAGVTVPTDAPGPAAARVLREWSAGGGYREVRDRALQASPAFRRPTAYRDAAEAVRRLVEAAPRRSGQERRVS